MAWLMGSKHMQAKRMIDQLDDRSARASAIGGLVRMGADAVPALLEALETGAASLEPMLLDVLARMGTAAIPPLAKALGEGHPLLRARAARALGLSGDRSTVPLLIDVLHSPYHTVRAAAADALGVLADKSSLAPLLASLQDSEPRVRISAVLALAGFHDPETLAPVTNILLDDPVIEVRQAAARSLGSMRDPAVLPYLMDALHDSFWWYEREAAAADLLRSIQALGKAAIPSLIRALQDPEGAVRRYAAILLGELADPQAIDALGLALYDLHHDVGEAAARALSRMGPASLAALEEAARHPEATIRGHAALALGSINSVQSVTVLLQLLQDADRGVRRQALISLSAFEEPRARIALRELAADRSDREFQSLARQALGQAG